MREALEQRATRAVDALSQHREALALECTKTRRHVPQARVRGEEDKRSSVKSPRDVLDEPRRFFDEGFLAG